MEDKMEKIKQKTDGCAHNWVDVCVVYHPKMNAEGKAVKCENCHSLGFIKDKSDVKRPIIVNGYDVFQAEYLPNGKPYCVWDAHL